jgi:hypothetical protein
MFAMMAMDGMAGHCHIYCVHDTDTTGESYGDSQSMV